MLDQPPLDAVPTDLDIELPLGDNDRDAGSAFERGDQRIQ
jgi:hypothetical protein